MDSTDNFFRYRPSIGIFKRLGQLSRPVFISAGLLMLAQVFIIGLRRYGLDLVPEWWAAPLAIGAVVACILGVITLYPRTLGHASRLAFAGVCTGVASVILLCTVAVWLLLRVLEFGAVPQSLPPLVQGSIALFMFTFVIALLLSAAACLKTDGLRIIGLLLLVPVFSWCLILGVAIVSTMGEALRLDFYTNGAIAVALIAVGFLVREESTPASIAGASSSSSEGEKNDITQRKYKSA